MLAFVESKPSPSSLAASFRKPAFRPAACSSREIRKLISMKIANACLKRVRSCPRVCAILTQLLALAFVPALLASSSAWTVSGIRDTGFSQQNKVTAAISPNGEAYSFGVPSFGAFCACSGPTLTLGDPSASLFFSCITKLAGRWAGPDLAAGSRGRPYKGPAYRISTCMTGLS